MSRKVTRRIRKTVRLLGIETLEAREMMSVSQLWFSRLTLCVKTDDVATSVEVRRAESAVTIKDLTTARNWTYAAEKVGQVEFQGGPVMTALSITLPT